jgi:hypothetical protein
VTKPGNSDPEHTGDEAAPDKAVPDGTASDTAVPDRTVPEAAVPVEETVAPEPVAKPRVEKAPPIPFEEQVMPTAGEAAARARAKRRFEEPAPRTLRISFYFFLAAGLIWLASMVISMVYKQQIIDAEVERNTNRELSADQIASGVTQILWIVLIAALAFTVFLALFGWKATEGTRRARTLVTILATVLVLFHLLLNGTPPGILSAMFALVGLALLWSPSARRYFPQRERR